MIEKMVKKISVFLFQLYLEKISWYLPSFAADGIHYCYTYFRQKMKERAKQKFINRFSSSNIEEVEVYNYLSTHNWSWIPYGWTNEYAPPQVNTDKSRLHYVCLDGKKIYFGSMGKRTIGKVTENLLCEMDVLSPHSYITVPKIIGTIPRRIDFTQNNFEVKKGDVVADIGSAEGIFSLSIIELAAHVYIFEPNKEWIKVLKTTFKEYKHKVTIIDKYVSDIDSKNTIKLDTFFRDIKVNFIKIDIEGFEKKCLDGATNLLSSRNDIKVAICTYHKPEDALLIKKRFRELGYVTHYSYGFLCLGSELRRGVLRAERKTLLV
jgi:predicted RNA methylase